MHGHTEPLDQQRLQHLRHLLFRGALRHLGHDVEPFGLQPVRPDHLIRLHVVRRADQIGQRCKTDIHPRRVNFGADVHLARHHGLRIHRRRRLDAGYFERQSRSRSLCRAASGRQPNRRQNGKGTPELLHGMNLPGLCHIFGKSSEEPLGFQPPGTAEREVPRTHGAAPGGSQASMTLPPLPESRCNACAFRNAT